MSQQSFHSWFLGAYGENHALVEELIVEAVRDHFFWRRNFHPESSPTIPSSAQYSADYLGFVATLKSEIYRLSADLKASVPFFSPRYIGHMASDLLIPGIVGRVATLLYNPNHVSEDVSPATLEKELIVGEQLAAMLGFEVDGATRAFGHMTSGGTVANYEGLRNLMAARYYPVAAASAARELLPPIRWRGRLLSDYSPHEMANLSVTDAVDLRRSALLDAAANGVTDWVEEVEKRRYEEVGLTDFLGQHPELGRPRVLVSSSGHYSWKKAMKLLGLGSSHLSKIEVDASMRVDGAALAREIESIRSQGDSVVAVVPILGTTEFGALDPVHEIVALRNRFREEGFEFGLHLDAAWGGYLASLFRGPDGELRARDDVASGFKYFPSESVHQTFDAIRCVDSATVDPHKLGFIPYPAGAYVARDRNIIDFVAEDAAYVFEETEEDDSRFRMLGRYILEGSKPGAAVASVYLTHKTIPLHSNGFGRIIGESIRSCEYFWGRAMRWREQMRDVATLALPFEPDANIACFALAPANVSSVAEANDFSEQVLERLSTTAEGIPRDRDFMVSSTKLPATDNSPRFLDLLEALGLDRATLGEEGGEALLVFRHTLMNPWLLSTNEDGLNYIDLYFDYLAELVTQVHDERAAQGPVSSRRNL